VCHRHSLKLIPDLRSAQVKVVQFIQNAALQERAAFLRFMSVPDDFKERLSAGYVMPVIETMPADLLTPLGVYLKLSQAERHSFLLESVSGGENLARYSFVGAGPEMVVVGNDTEYSVLDGGSDRTHAGSVWRFIRGHFERYKTAELAGGFPSFIGGAIGYLGFGCSRWFEPSLTGVGSSRDEAGFMFYRSLVAFDHARQEIKLITLVFPAGLKDRSAEHLYDSARANNSAIRNRLENSTVPRRAKPVGNSSPVTSNFSPDAFQKAVGEVKELIAVGECYQVVLSQRFEKRTNVNAVAIYRAIRSLNPSPYMFLLDFDGKAVVGASPEMLVRSRGRRLEYRPIAGTRPRGITEADDSTLAEEMRRDKKEVAEHVMLVDLGRNDVGRVCEYGSVEVEELMSVEKYSHVQHLVSSVTGTLRKGLDRFDALASCFPAGTVSGAPKVRAINIICELEPTDRGIYAGAVGYFDYSGNMDTCIAIRTVVLEDGVAKIQAGAGIVADSDPEAEFCETVNKARAMIRAIEIAEQGQ
jgi:anthranilate synthase component 1